MPYSSFRSAADKGEIQEVYFFTPRSLAFRLRTPTPVAELTQPPMNLERLLAAATGSALAPQQAAQRPTLELRSVLRTSMPGSDNTLLEALRRSGTQARLPAARHRSHQQHGHSHQGYADVITGSHTG